MSIEFLPEDIVEYIMLHLTPYGDMQACKLVCRQWYRLASGAMSRLNRLFRRCDAFEWYILQQNESVKYGVNIAERCSHAACFHPNGSMFVFGGCTAAYTTFNDLWRFDLATRSWSRPIPMGTFPTPKACATMVEYRGSLLLFGGWSKSSPNPIHQTAMFFNELHFYNPAQNIWTEITSDCSAPHLAGHSATIVNHFMVVFGGSMGNSSSNTVWLFDINARTWSQPPVSAHKPAPRYGQSQMKLDDRHLLIVGGCGGPNMVFSDVWLLTLPSDGDQTWHWQEILVINPHLSAPQLWSHPSCLVGDKCLVLSKPQRSRTGSLTHRHMSSSFPRVDAAAAASAAACASAGKTWVPPQGNLLPPRRKLLSSKSLDEQDGPVSPKSCAPKKSAELHRASSIPAIIVGEIPKLVVTKEDNSADSTGSGGDACGSNQVDYVVPTESRSPCIAMAASSLLPHQATPCDVPSSSSSSSTPADGIAGGRRARPSVRPNANNDRSRQLQLLRRMEEYIQSRTRTHSSESPSQSARSPPSTPSFRFNSPPPKSKHHRPADFVLSRNPMCVYALDVSNVMTLGSAAWAVIEPDVDAPEDTILYSLVAGRGELIMFGGMRSGTSVEQQGLDVTPFTHTITNETYILRPPISL